jgi:hypothetical protein
MELDTLGYHTCNLGPCNKESAEMKDAGKFKSWLTKRGAVVLDATNQWEVVRFKTVNGVSVIYTRQNGHLTFTGESEEAYKAYKANRVWKAVDRKRQNLRAHKARLATRDGKKCFCCNAKLGYDAKVDKSLTINGYPLTSNVVLPDPIAGRLDQVNNTSDLNKPISLANLFEAFCEKGRLRDHRLFPGA